MTASYPTTVKSFVTKVDFTDTVLAEHVNSLQLEVTSIETVLGTSIRTGSGWVGEFDTITSSWNTLKDRIANIEYGLKDVYDEYVSDVGGSVIVSSAIGVKSLVVRARTSQTANLIEFQNSTSTVVTKVLPDGTIQTRDKELVPVIYAATQPTGSNYAAGTIWVDSSTEVEATALSGGSGSLVDTLMLMGG